MNNKPAEGAALDEASTKSRSLARGWLVIAGCLLLLLVLAAGSIVWQMKAPRPPDTTSAEVFQGDGAAIDYCSSPPDLDGSGLSAADIPKAYTPGCGWRQWPIPILANCTEPLADGVQDFRGLWRGQTADGRDHVERIEQCGNRMIVTSAGIIHDFLTDNTLANGAHDVMGGASCRTMRAAVGWDDGVLAFRPYGVPFTLVRRELHGDTLQWTYPGLGKVSLKRICRVPLPRR